MSTFEWLKDSLVLSDGLMQIQRLGRVWTHVAGFSQCGSVFAIYKDTSNFCAHAGDEWKELEEPLLGYYDRNLSWDELLLKLAETYDKLRATTRP